MTKHNQESWEMFETGLEDADAVTPDTEMLLLLLTLITPVPRCASSESSLIISQKSPGPGRLKREDTG